MPLFCVAPILFDLRCQRLHPTPRLLHQRGQRPLEIRTFPGLLNFLCLDHRLDRHSLNQDHCVALGNEPVAVRVSGVMLWRWFVPLLDRICPAIAFRRHHLLGRLGAKILSHAASRSICCRSWTKFDGLLVGRRRHARFRGNRSGSCAGSVSCRRFCNGLIA